MECDNYSSIGAANESVDHRSPEKSNAISSLDASMPIWDDSDEFAGCLANADEM